MSVAVSNERLIRILQATPEQLALVDRVLEGKALVVERPQGGHPELASDGKDGRDGSEEFWTKKELAQRLKVTVRTIENWQRCGVLSFIKIRKVVLFHPPDVVRQLKENFGVSRRTLGKG